MAARQPRVVAELGRPETPAETAQRKAESSRLHRVRQTPNNLVLSLLVTVVAVAVIFFAVPRSDKPLDLTVDWHSIAADAQATTPITLADPELPATWKANTAAYRTGAADGVDNWFIGFLTPGDEFVGLTQAFVGTDGTDTAASDVWVAKQVKNTLPTGATTIDGVTWTVYDNRESSADVGNARYAMVASTPVSTWLLAGTASTDEFETLARSIASTITAEEQ